MTKQLTDKITKAEKGDMLNFSFDTGLSVQTYDGVDYSDAAFRDQLILLNADTLGKRERKQAAAPLTYTPDALVKTRHSQAFAEHTIRLPRSFRLPRMENFMFFDQKRLMQISEWEFEALHMLRQKERRLSQEQQNTMTTILPANIAEEKKKLLAAGFPMFNKRDYFRFVKGISNKGKDSIEAVAADMGVAVDLVEDYAKAFWEVGESHLGEKEWARVMKQFEKGQESVKTRATLSKMLTTYLGMFKDPRNEMTFTARSEKPFVLDSDRSMLVANNKHGYGEWDKIKKEVTSDRGMAFNHQIQGISDKEMSKRIDHRLRMLEREIAQKSGATAASAKAMKAAEEHLKVEHEIASASKGERYTPVVHAAFKETVEKTTQFRENNKELWRKNLLLIEQAAENVRGLTEDARSAIFSGVGNVGVNFSLRGGLEGTGSTEFGIGLGDFSERPQTLLGVELDKKGPGAKKGTRGPKRKKVAIVDEHKPVLAQSIGILGSNERTKIVEEVSWCGGEVEGERGVCQQTPTLRLSYVASRLSQFVAKYPQYHQKDVNDLFGKMTVRKKYPFLPSHVKPNNSRNKCWFYLRAHFYNLASDDDKAMYLGWEAVKLEDDKAYEEELSAKKEKQQRYRDKEKARKKGQKGGDVKMGDVTGGGGAVAAVATVAAAGAAGPVEGGEDVKAEENVAGMDVVAT